jgi:hypothetical protein
VSVHTPTPDRPINKAEVMQLMNASRGTN